jgi:replicative DNA helicase
MTTDTELEASILGAMIAHPYATLDLASQMLHPAMFTGIRYKKIFGTMLYMSDKGMPIDLVSLAAELHGDDINASDLAELTSKAYVVGNFEHYIHILSNEYQKNQGSRAARSLAENLAGANGNAADVLNAGLKEIQAIADNHNTLKADRETSDIAQGLKKDVQWVIDHPGKLPGITTIFPRLDTYTQGYQPANDIIIGAYTSTGKSAFIQQTAVRQAQAGIPVALITLEMTAQECLCRMAAQLHRVNATQLRYPSGEEQAKESLRIIEKMGQIGNLHILESPGIRLNDLTALIRSVVRRHGVRIVYIDYLNLVSGESRKDAARYLELAEISRALKVLAVSLNITIVSAAQLGRDSDNRAPKLRDVRESIDIVFDSDITMFLHRERIQEDGVEVLSDEATLSIAKNRNGPLGAIKLLFHPGYLVFEEAKQ